MNKIIYFMMLMAVSILLTMVAITTSLQANEIGIDLSEVSPLTANPTLDKSHICAGEQVQLTANVEGGTPPYTFTWTESVTANTFTDSVPVVTPSKTTTYQLRIVDNVGQSYQSSDLLRVVVYAMPRNFEVEVEKGGEYCAGGPGLAITLSGSEAGVNYQLFLGDVNESQPVISRPGTNNPLSFGLRGEPGSYYVHATKNIKISEVNTLQCSAKMSGMAEIIVNELPEVFAGDDTTTYHGDRITFSSASVTKGTATYTYSWSSLPPNQFDTNESKILHATTKQLNSDSQFTLTATDLKGCASSGSVTVSVGPPLNVKVSSDRNVVCAGDVIRLTGEASGGSGTYSYAWTGNGLSNNSINNPTAKPEMTNLYEFTVTDIKSGYKVSAPVIITVQPLPVEYQLSTSANHICQDSTAQLSLNLSQPFIDYVLIHSDPLSPGDTISGTGSPLYFPVTKQGNYYVVAINPQTRCSLAMANTVSINVISPSPLATENIHSKIVGDVPVMLIYPADTTNALNHRYAYQWYKDDKQIPEQNKQYYILTPTERVGNHGFKVLVKPPDPDEHGLKCGWFSTTWPGVTKEFTDINRVSNLFKGIYPNPAKDWVHVTLDSEWLDNKVGGAYINVYNTSGIRVLHEKITQSAFTLNLGELTGGLYMLQITADGMAIDNYKLIVY